jgi:putative DNA methylase
MAEEAAKRIGNLYPKIRLPKDKGGAEARVIAWIWARTVSSPDPAAKGAHVPLVRSFVLSSKAGQKAWVVPKIDRTTMSYTFEVSQDGTPPSSGTVGRNGATCLLTGSPIPLEHVRREGRAGRLGTKLLAIVAERGKAKTFVSPTKEHEDIAKAVTPPADAPDTDLPVEALGFRVQNYGMTKHRQLFTPRQLTALVTFSALVKEARAKVLADSSGDQAYADAVCTYLGCVVGRGADYWSSFALWAGEFVAHTFGRNALSMVWDFAEVNPLAEGTGSWLSGVEWVRRVVDLLPARSTPVSVVQSEAQKITPNGKVCFSTDPPYYDNVPYADLSDFFYVWLRRSLQDVYPDLLNTVLVPKAAELVAEPFRHGGRDHARDFFEQGMREVFVKLKNSSDDGFPITIYYAFKQAEGEEEPESTEESGQQGRASTGWETFLQGLVDAGWEIHGTWPVRTERPGRLRETGSNALASSIVLVCRPRSAAAEVVARRDFLHALKKELPAALRLMQKGSVAPVDLAQSAIGPGMAVFSRYTEVLETDGTRMKVQTALALINQALDEVLAEQEGEFDSETRYALSWFDQFGFAEGPYGKAETLSTAKNTSMSAMEDCGILVAKGGKVRLLAVKELKSDWMPSGGERLTTWRVTHQLVRALETGEQAAAALLARMQEIGPDLVDAARDLAYRLFVLSDNRKRASEALGYNALVTAWPDLLKLSRSAARNPSQAGLL